MRLRILFLLSLASACASLRISYSIIKPLGAERVEFYLVGQSRQLNDLLNNPDPRVCEKISLFQLPIEDIRRIFEVYGKEAKNVLLQLSYKNKKTREEVKYKAQDVFDALNLLPNLEELTFALKEGELDGEVVGTLNLQKLKKVTVDWKSESSSPEIEFLSKVLPENILTTLEIYGDGINENYGELLNKQRNLKTLKLKVHNPTFNEAFNNLKLETFEYTSFGKSIEMLSARRTFLKAVINSQPDLRTLTYFWGHGPKDNMVDDDFLLELSKLSKLEKLQLLLDGEGLSNLEPLQNLKSLKELLIHSDDEKFFELFNQFSNLKFETLEKLYIDASSYGRDLPAETFERISQNMPNLKRLEVPRNYHHTINFYAQAFPQIEEIDMRFGASDKRFQFGDAFDKNVKVVQRNLKKIKFDFRYDENFVNADDFVGFLEMFPNLESLEIESKFPFTTQFLSKLADNLNNLKILKINSFEVDRREKFPHQKTEALKELGMKLKHNKMRLFVKLRGTFNFQPLIDEIKDVYKCEKGTRASLPELFLEAGGE